MPKFFAIKIGGEAGFGVMVAALTISRIATRSGYNVFTYTEYPSLVRGGLNASLIYLGLDPIESPHTTIDYLIALNQETLDKFAGLVTENGWVMYDPEWVKDLSKASHLKNQVSIPLTEIVRSLKGSFIMRNNVAIAATIGLLGGKLSHLEDLVNEEFADKKPEVLEINNKVLQLGYEYTLAHFSHLVTNHLSHLDSLTHNLPKIVLTGNEAISMGAIAAGMQFASIYPMTPTSNILHYLASHQEKFGYVYKQPEDEIAGINLAIGAAFAGVRSMVATSGGGFALMSESIGLAGMTETPVVIIDGMRGGPATGLPTWNEQGDLRQVLGAGQGDFLKIVLAAGDVDEAFYLTLKAFNLADKYQTPVILLVDRYLCESYKSTTRFDLTKYSIDRGKYTTSKVDDYKRYQLEADGISTRTIPSSENYFIANSDEHNEIGLSEDDAYNRIKQMTKRMKKLEHCITNDMENPKIYGDEDADNTIIAWGSTKGAILEALKILKEQNPNQKYKYIHNVWLNPFPSIFIKNILENSKNVIAFEQNYTGQYVGLIREKTGYEIKRVVKKIDGRPFLPEEIVEHLKSLKGEQNA